MQAMLQSGKGLKSESLLALKNKALTANKARAIYPAG